MQRAMESDKDENRRILSEILNLVDKRQEILNDPESQQTIVNTVQMVSPSHYPSVMLER